MTLYRIVINIAHVFVCLIFAQAMLSKNISKYSWFMVFQVVVSSTISHDYVVLFLSVGLIPLCTVHSVLDIDPALEKSLLWLASLIVEWFYVALSVDPPIIIIIIIIN